MAEVYGTAIACFKYSRTCSETRSSTGAAPPSRHDSKRKARVIRRRSTRAAVRFCPQYLCLYTLGILAVRRGWIEALPAALVRRWVPLWIAILTALPFLIPRVLVGDRRFL